ncbi:hypothetical protein [Lentzea aerocolonigenes]|uniref:hypothetical protein n=1 Tax=Lentzea aerocolonigenes TaxID=68170 RepID=UPI000B0E7744|nr:hypothetical protein [Lentzea aerocolonigenes]MCP2249538.1 hypothetical protein [Lentzea aerocolonigenes]
MTAGKNRAWWVCGGAIVCGGAVWALLRFGVPVVLSDANHPARPALEALSWIAGIASLLVAVVALIVALRQSGSSTPTATHGGIVFTGNVTGGSGSGPTTGVHVEHPPDPPSPARPQA